MFLLRRPVRLTASSLLLAGALWLLPARPGVADGLETAPDPGAAYPRPRVPPDELRCDDRSEKLERKAEPHIAQLNSGSGVDRAINKLRGLEAPGCDALARWIRAGHPGGTQGDLKEAASWLVRFGEGAQFLAGAGVLIQPDNGMLPHVWAHFPVRGAVISPDQTDALLAMKESVQIDTLDLLLGIIRDMKTVYSPSGDRYVSVFSLSEHPLPPEHVYGLSELARRPHAQEELIDRCTSIVSGGLADLDRSWRALGQVLLPMALDPNAPLRGKAARIIALGELKGIDRLMEQAVGPDAPWLPGALLGGFGDRISDLAFSDVTLARLEWLAQNLSGGHQAKAEKLLKKAEKKSR